VNPAGWRICYRPCSCGENYSPDAAKAATNLEPWEYRLDHEAYRPVDDFFEPQTQEPMESSVLASQEEGEAEDLSAQLAQFTIQDEDVGPSNLKVYVDTYLKKGKHVYFAYGGVEYKSSAKDWEWQETVDNSGNAAYYCECRQDGTVFWTYELPGAASDEDYAETKKDKKKGKGK